MSAVPAIRTAAPPSKSVSHRKLIAAALAKGVSRLSQVLESDDTARSMDALRALGASIERTAPGEYRIDGRRSDGLDAASRGAGTRSVSCDFGGSGTTCRLLTALFATETGDFQLSGEERLHERPLEELTSALERLGASFSFGGARGFLPATLHARGLEQDGEDAWLPVSCDTSSQFLSGLLLAAPRAKGGLGLILAGEKAVSWPYVGLTLQTMEDSGCRFRVEVLSEGRWSVADWKGLREVRPGRARFRVFPGEYRPLSGAAGRVEGDYSGASYLLAAGAVGPSPVTVANLKADSLQGDAVILDILRDMGASVIREKDAVTVSPGPLRGLAVDMGNCPDLVPTIAALAALAEGDTRITGVPHLRRKESDRLLAPALELAKMGCRVTPRPDGLDIHPAILPRSGPRSGEAIRFSAHNDHRMAMSLALLELAGVNVSLDAPDCVSKSFPSFWEVWRAVFPATRIPKERA
ncbi:MAG: 3-phosphoshikimate 1-carboxyvinyltransferase [Deltaproteobacteria bacterium]|jgi:3-phosphoshikimate 1-carboxyvinyltransferase|nr:3-phosphoshikimate 1-carboxyvinyltransferase [Deltaproteobacteria bacterium]